MTTISRGSGRREGYKLTSAKEVLEPRGCDASGEAIRWWEIRETPDEAEVRLLCRQSPICEMPVADSRTAQRTNKSLTHAAAWNRLNWTPSDARILLVVADSAQLLLGKLFVVLLLPNQGLYHVLIYRT